LAKAIEIVFIITLWLKPKAMNKRSGMKYDSLPFHLWNGYISNEEWLQPKNMRWSVLRIILLNLIQLNQLIQPINYQSPTFQPFNKNQ
jgi:hypothetical protein